MGKPRPLPGSWVDAWVQDERLPSGVRLLLYALANYMDKRGVCWPSVSTLARDTGYDRRHAFRLLAHGEALGWLDIDTEGGPKVRGGKLNLYRARMSPPRDNDCKGGDTHVTTSRSGDIQNESGDIHAPEVVTPMSYKRPRERPVGTSRKELVDSENRPPMSAQAWEETIAQRDPWQLALAGLNRFTIEEAKWLLRGLAQAEREGVVETYDEGPAELAALALYGMQRKYPRRWSRSRFVGFVSQAVAVRMDPTGNGDPDPYLSEAIERAWPL